jgi:hypothetical protein
MVFSNNGPNDSIRKGQEEVEETGLKTQCSRWSVIKKGKKYGLIGIKLCKNPYEKSVEY